MFRNLRKWSWREMHFGVCTAAMFSAAVLVGAITIAVGEVTKPAAELDGTWKLVAVERSEESQPLRQNVQWIVKGQQVFYGGELLGELKYDSTTKPKIVDLSLRDTKQTYEGLYAVADDRLNICLNVNVANSKERPTELSVQDKSNLRLLLFERIREITNDPPAGLIGIGLLFSLLFA